MIFAMFFGDAVIKEGYIAYLETEIWRKIQKYLMVA